MTILNLRQDANLQYLSETIKRIPLQELATVSLSASTQGSATINVPKNEMYFIKSFSITKGTNVTVNSITIDGSDIYEVAAVTDTVSRYGGIINADSNVVITGTNAGAGAENLEIQIKGYKLVF